MRGSYENMGLDAREANMKAKTNLKRLCLKWETPHNYEDELVLENLQPHNKISKLDIYGYTGEKLPKWMATNHLTSCLLHIETVKLYDCANIKHIPSFSQLPNLKCFRLRYLPEVKYLESNMDECGDSSAPSSYPRRFFPSLIEISIRGLPNLKGWRECRVGNLSFPFVARVTIVGCKKLESFPSCPNVEDLEIEGVRNVQLLKEGGISSSTSSPIPKLKRLSVDSVEYLASLPRECLLEVSQLEFSLGGQPLDVSQSGKGLEGMTSLEVLRLWSCNGLISFSTLPVQLSTLKRLEIYVSPHISFLSDGDQSDEAWQMLKRLCFLKFDMIKDLKVLPRGIRHLSALQSLELSWCDNFEAIPDWIGDLCSLSHLEIAGCHKLTSLPQEMTILTGLKLLLVHDCPELGRRCQRDTGEDWHKIQHVKEVITR